jgi:hypothetical protein
MLIALAGRRVDASDATQKRFPAENASAIKQQIRDFRLCCKKSLGIQKY